MDWEFSFLYWIQTMHHPWLDAVLKAITSLGDHGWFFIALGIGLLFHVKTRGNGIRILVSLALGFFIGNLLLKNMIARERPCWLDLGVALLIENPQDFSFPSGHSLAAFETAVSIYCTNRKWGILFLILAAVIGFSRLYLFVHFPTDVLAGAILGTGIALVVNWGYRRYIVKGF